MNVEAAAELVFNALNNSVETWLEFSPKFVPVVIYDNDDFVFFNHPDPPIERPDQLMAASAVEINGALTATIPTEICVDAKDLIPLVYHESFHAYQADRFKLNEGGDFFRAIAYYPELQPDYRALCAAESEVLNQTKFSSIKKCAHLSTLVQERHQILAKQDGLLSFELNLEQIEGTASFVEQKARFAIFGEVAKNKSSYFSYSRQYIIGAAYCWLLDEIAPQTVWKREIESGASISDCLLKYSERNNLVDLNLDLIEETERDLAKKIKAKANGQIDELINNGTITIKLPNQKRVARSLNPSAVISLGDGRMIHPDSVGIYVPNGKIEVSGAMTLEDFPAGEIILPKCLYRYSENKLLINSETVKIDLENVIMKSDGVFNLTD